MSKFGLYFIVLFFSVFSIGQTYEKTEELYAQAELELEKNELEKAAQLYEAAALNELQLEAPRIEDSYQILSIASYLFFKTEHFERALDNRDASLILYEKLYGTDNQTYTLGLNWMIVINLALKNYDQIIALSEQAENLNLKHLGEDNEEYRLLLNNIGRSYQLSGQPNLALSYYKKVIEISEKTIGKQNIEYANYTNNLAQLYNELQQPDMAFPLFKEVVEIAKTNLNENSDLYAVYLKNLGTLYVSTRKFNEGIEFYTKEANFFSSKSGKDNLIYADILQNLGLMFRGLENFSEAEKSLFQSKEIYEKHQITNNEDFGKILCEISELYRLQGKTEQALNYSLQGTEIIGKTVGKTDIEYAVRMNNLGLIYQDLGQFDKAVFTVSEALPIMEQYFGIGHSEYNVVLGGLARLYQNMKQFDKATILFLEIIEQTKKSVGTSNSSYLIAINNLANLYQEVNLLDKSEIYFSEALKIAQEIYPSEHSAIARQMNNLSIVYQHQNKQDKALVLQKEAVKIAENLFGKKHTEYGKYLNNLALTYLRLEEFQKAIPLQEEVVQIFREKNSSHSEMANYLTNLALMYYGIGDSDKALKPHLESLNILKNHIQQAFSLLSETEKEKFIESNQYNFNVVQSYFSDVKKQKEIDFGPPFDVELMTKALILNASQHTRETILKSNDKEAKDLYQSWLINKKILAQQYALLKEEQLQDLYPLEIKSEKLEKQLILKANSIETAPKIGKITWKDIQNNLKENEVAVEFASFNYWNGKTWTDQIRYIALVLQKNDKFPQLIPLFEQKELNTILSFSGDDKATINQIYRGSKVQSVKQDLGKLYNLIWKPLEEYLKEGQTVYFAPSGTLHQIAFSAVKNKDGKFLSDIYDLKQVSTTAKILHKNDKIKLDNIALFGGIDYDKGEWTYLKGTLSEVENIKKLAEKSNIKTDFFSEKIASEEKFKSLNGNNSPNILHIATHGFFYPDIENKHTENELFNAFKTSNNPLNRSGLLFVGANKTWNGNFPKDGSEDGILTAYEVSHTSLPNTELVVLSACETGLGDIKGSEGVFGLQRAFKSAGANYLLMSLWKVPDKETAEFMEEFYKNLFQTKDIETSFSKTQNFMKAKYPKNPYSWAAFVLTR